ncbi:MAG: hypothetical protein WAZ19_11485 [Anaerolineae bacterium]
MEFFLAIGAGSAPPRKERFAEFGQALERATELINTAAATPLEITDTGEHQVLDAADLQRLAAWVGQFAPMDDTVARAVLQPLPAATLDALARWLLFRMRAAGIAPRARLAVLGSVLDAVKGEG